MIAAPVSAEPLCRDLKGLFTPCPKELNKQAAGRLEARTLRQWAGRRGDKAGTETDAARTPSSPKRQPFVAGVTVSDPGKHTRAKLCHDLKGLYTPCAK